MFTPAERALVRDRVFALARSDHRVTGGAVTGSGAVGAEDRWSDIDTAFGVADGVDPYDVLRDWTDVIERELEVVHRFDLVREPTVYRVYLLSNAIELDISLTPASAFGARGPSFQLVFGESSEQPATAAPDADELIGWGWIYVLNARAAIERDRPWQAAHFINSVRDYGLALACVRCGLPAVYARGYHRLPADATEPWRESFMSSLDPSELRRALDVVARAFLTEVSRTDSALGERLRAPLTVA